MLFNAFDSALMTIIYLDIIYAPFAALSIFSAKMP